MRQAPFLPQVRGLVVLLLSAILVLVSCSPATESDPSTPSTSASHTTTPTADPSANPSGNPSDDSGVPSANLAAFYEQHVTWRSCGNFECATIAVPLFYDDPDADTVQLSAIRRVSRSKNRQGSLLINPGGPGSSAVEYLLDSTSSFPRRIKRAYDLVGVDPRGVGESDSVVCLKGKKALRFEREQGPPSATTPLKQIQKANEAMGQACEKKASPIVETVDSVTVARDMDIVRAVLGDPALNFLGYSYGSYIGTVYAMLFPEQVGRMVFDGAVDYTEDWQGSVRSQAIGFDRAYTRFLEDCFTYEDCPFPSNLKKAEQKTIKLIRDVGKHELETDEDFTNGTPLNQTDLVNAILSMLYTEDDWEDLRDAFDSAFNGDGTIFQLSSDIFFDREDGGTYMDNEMAAYTAVTCLDNPYPQGAAGLAAIEQLSKELSRSEPIFGPTLAWEHLACTTWPFQARHAAPAGPALELPAILVVNTEYDPATPIESARSLAKFLPSATLLELKGSSTHTSYPGQSRCIDDLVSEYLLTGESPDADVACPR